MPNTTSPNRPNILWLSMEDTTPRFGCYGDELAQTPNIDRLAAGGCRYPNAFSTAGVCAPSRSAIITGCYQTAIGSMHMRTAHTNAATPEMCTPYEAVPPHWVKCFPEYLRAQGYYCSNNSKTDYQFAPPITAWDDCSPQAHWRNRAEGQPFFAVFNPTWTHESGMWADHADPPPSVTDPAKVTLPPYVPDTPETRKALAAQYDNIAREDAFLGEILDQLEADGLAENTIVFLWSDHGEGLPRAKRWPYDGGIRIPLIVRAPKGTPHPLPANSVCQDMISLVDLGPTVLSLTGTPIPAHMHGQPFLGPKKAPPRKYIYASRDRYDESYDMIRACRDRRYKYIRNFRPELPYLLWIPYRNRHAMLQAMWEGYRKGTLEGPQKLMFEPRPVEELYDTQEDPWEINNLANDPAHRQTLERLRDECEHWRTTFGDMGSIPESEMVRRWYPDGQQPETAHVVFIPFDDEHIGREPGDEATLADPAIVQLHCSTQGASMAWTTEEGDDAKWNLYTQPVRLEKGQTTLRAQAHRIGYKPGPICTAKYTVE